MKARTGALILALLALGCRRPPPDLQNAQGGRYSAIGESSATFGRVHITTVCGNKLDPSGGIVGPLENVLYFAVSLPESHEGSSWMAKSEATRTVWYLGHAPKTGGGIHVEVVWNRAADVVIIEGKRFDRSAGNVFLIETVGHGYPVFHQNSKVRSERVPEGQEARVVDEEFPHLASFLKTFP
jgi:hypothetical protein